MVIALAVVRVPAFARDARPDVDLAQPRNTSRRRRPSAPGRCGLSCGTTSRTWSAASSCRCRSARRDLHAGEPRDPRLRVPPPNPEWGDDSATATPIWRSISKTTSQARQGHHHGEVRRAPRGDTEAGPRGGSRAEHSRVDRAHRDDVSREGSEQTTTERGGSRRAATGRIGTTTDKSPVATSGGAAVVARSSRVHAEHARGRRSDRVADVECRQRSACVPHLVILLLLSWPPPSQ